MVDAACEPWDVWLPEACFYPSNTGPLQKSFLDDVAGAGGGAETLFAPLLFFSNIFVTICMNHFV